MEEIYQINRHTWLVVVKSTFSSLVRHSSYVPFSKWIKSPIWWKIGAHCSSDLAPPVNIQAIWIYKNVYVVYDKQQ